MKKKFVINLAILLFLNLFVKLFWIFKIDRTVQNTVGAEAYGTYFSLFSLSVILNIFLDAGTTSFNNRTVARNAGSIAVNFPNIVLLKLMLSVLYAVICLATGLILHYDRQQFLLLLILILNQALASFLLFMRSNISGLQHFITDSILSVLDRFVVIVVCGLLLWTSLPGKPFRIEWFAYAQTLGYGFALFMSILLLLRQTGRLRIRTEKNVISGIIRQSIPFALLILLMGIYNRIDSVMLERMLPADGKTQAGIYAQAFRLLDAVSMFGVLFAGLLLPMFSRMLARKENTGDLLQLAALLILIPSVLLCFGSWIYARPIMHALYPLHVDLSAQILSFLMTGFLGIAMTYIFGTLLTANGSLRELNLMALCVLTLNVVLNLLLIPRMQAIGSAVSSMITQIVAAAIQVILASRILHFTVNRKILGRITLFLVLSFAMALGSARLTTHWMVNLIAFLLGGFLLAEILKLFSIPGLIRLIRNETPVQTN